MGEGRWIVDLGEREGGMIQPKLRDEVAQTIETMNNKKCGNFLLGTNANWLELKSINSGFPRNE